jgi:O-antigen/teichoic acid export membrane protein
MNGLSFLIGLWAAKLLGTAEFGSLQLARTILGYLTILPLGVTVAVSYELPIALAREDEDEARKVRGILVATLVFVCLVQAITMVALEGAGVSLNGLFFHGQWLLLALVSILATWSIFPSVLFVTHEQFIRLALCRLARIAPFIILALLLIPAWGMRGFLAAMAIGTGVYVGVGLAFQARELCWHWNAARWWRYVKFGLPVRINALLFLILTSVDLWLVSAYLGREATGVYAFAIMVSTAVYSLPRGTLYELALPTLTKSFGKAGRELGAVTQLLVHYTIGSATLYLAIAAVSLVIFSGIIDTYLPRYESAKTVLPILLFGRFINSSLSGTTRAIILAGKQHVITAVYLIGLAAGVAFDILVLETVRTLWAVAVVTCICLIGQALWVFAISLRLLGKTQDLSAFRSAMLASAGACLVSLLFLVWVDFWFNGLMQIGIGLGIAALVTIPAMIFGVKNLRAFWAG